MAYRAPLIELHPEVLAYYSRRELAEQAARVWQTRSVAVEVRKLRGKWAVVKR